MPVFTISSDYIVTSSNDVLTIHRIRDSLKVDVVVPKLRSGKNSEKNQQKETRDMTFAQYFPDSKLLVVGDSDKVLSLFCESPSEGQVWSLQKQWQLERKVSHVTIVNSEVMVVDKTGDVYSFHLNEESSSGKLRMGHLSIILDLLITNDQKFIVTSDRDEKIRVTHFPNCYNIQSFCLGHREFVSSILELGNPNLNRQLLMSGSGDGTLRLWDIVSGQQLYQEDVGHPVKQIVRHEDQIAVSFYSHSSVHFYNLLINGEKPLLYLQGKHEVGDLITIFELKDNIVFLTRTGLSLFKKGQNEELSVILKEIEVSQDFVKYVNSVTTDEEQLKFLKKEAYDNVQQYLQKKNERVMSEQTKKFKNNKSSLRRYPEDDDEQGDIKHQQQPQKAQ
jgi:tRNA (guanine-N(7)-)-methyltransferase subunit TRM82